MLFKHVFVVGAGGIGSHLLESLTRLLSYHERGTKNITVIDGDQYEEKNRIRQLFAADLIGMNKAEAATKRLLNCLGDEKAPIKPVTFFIDRYRFSDILAQSGLAAGDRVLVVGAVDNQATRKDLILALESIAEDSQNFVYIDGGNGYANGQVLVFAKEKGVSLTLHPFDKYQDLKHPEDHIPGEGCQEEAPSTPQLITANASAALGILWSVQAMLDGKPWFEEIHFDTQKMKLMPLGDPRKFPTETELAEYLAAKNAKPVVKEISIPVGIFASEPTPALANS